MCVVGGYSGAAGGGEGGGIFKFGVPVGVFGSTSDIRWLFELGVFSSQVHITCETIGKHLT